MTMTIASATARLVREVPKVEQDIDQALLSLSGLLSTMVLARNAPGVAPGTGTMALHYVGKAIDGLVAVSSDMSRAHGRLLTIYRETGIGDTDECPPDKGALREMQSKAS